MPNRTKRIVSLGTVRQLLVGFRGEREKRSQLGDSLVNDLGRPIAIVVFIIIGRAEIEVGQDV